MKILAELLIYSHMKEISRSEMFFFQIFFSGLAAKLKKIIKIDSFFAQL